MGHGEVGEAAPSKYDYLIQALSVNGADHPFYISVSPT